MKFSQWAAVLVIVVASHAVSAIAGTTRRYTGSEVRELRDAFNANKALLQGVMDDVEDISAKLNGLGTADELLTTTFAPTNSGSTVDTLAGSN